MRQKRLNEIVNICFRVWLDWIFEKTEAVCTSWITNIIEMKALFNLVNAAQRLIPKSIYSKYYNCQHKWTQLSIIHEFMLK